MRFSLGILLAVLILSLAAWAGFYLIWGEPLQPAETTIVVGACMVAVLLAKWTWRSLRNRSRRGPTALSVAIFVFLAAQIGRGSELPVACSPEAPVVSLQETIPLKAWAVAPPGGILLYRWTAQAGRLSGEGSEVRWDLSGNQPGSYAASVEVSNAGGEQTVCTVQVFALRDTETLRGGETRRMFLLRDRQEESGYRLYSYVLFGSPPSDVGRERYRKAIDGYLHNILPVARLREFFQPSELNMTYLPLQVGENTKISLDADWLLAHYDWERARFLLRSLPGAHARGPYILSCRRPLSTIGTLDGDYLRMDLSSVPPSQISAWVEEFLNQTAQEQFWKERTGPMLALRLRTVISVLAQALPDVQSALAGWITWVEKK